MSNRIFCVVEGCQEFYQTLEPVSKNARYICRWHPRGQQIEAIGRAVTEDDFRDREIRFQEYQFDPDLARGGNPKVDAPDETEDQNDGGTFA